VFRALEDEDSSVRMRHPGPVTMASLKQNAEVPFSTNEVDLEWGFECEFPEF
jgi:hypothetical protein